MSETDPVFGSSMSHTARTPAPPKLMVVGGGASEKEGLEVRRSLLMEPKNNIKIGEFQKLNLLRENKKFGLISIEGIYF